MQDGVNKPKNKPVPMPRAVVRNGKPVYADSLLINKKPQLPKSKKLNPNVSSGASGVEPYVNKKPKKL